MPLHMATKCCPWRVTSFPSLWRGRANALLVTCSGPTLRSLFFQMLCIILGSSAYPEQVPHVLPLATLSIFSLKITSPNSCAGKSQAASHSLLVWSRLLGNFCWLHRLCFRPDVKLHCNPIKPIVPEWPFLFWKTHFQWCYHFSRLRGETLWGTWGFSC